VKRPALVIPLAVILAVIGIAVALRLPHTLAAHHGGTAQTQTSARSCGEHKPDAPFVGVAINPPVTQNGHSFAAATGIRPAVVEFYDAFGRHFQQHEAEQAISLGALPLIQLNPRNAPLTRIAAGHYDAYLRQYAIAVREFGCQVALSFGHEMNGSWYPWGRPDTSPATFIAAWRHIHHIFTTEHARNVIWAWDPDHGGSKASKWWPGNSYVDWIGIDGYLRPGQTFRLIFRKQLADIRSLTSKPVFIAETAVAPGPDQAMQISRLFAAIRKHHLIGLTWFDINAKEPWRLEGNPPALAAFRKAASAIRQ
jgi:mannan endo-1,4-beta-mannosidase